MTFSSLQHKNKIKKHSHILAKLAKTRSIRKRESILNKAPDAVVDLISEIIHNLLKGNLKVKNSVFTRLKKQKHLLRRLGSKRTSVKSRKRHIIQNGGFVGGLLAAALPILSSLIGSVIS